MAELIVRVVKSRVVMLILWVIPGIKVVLGVQGEASTWIQHVANLVRLLSLQIQP